MGGGRGLWRRLRPLGRDPAYERSRSRWMAYRVIGCNFRNSCLSYPGVEALGTGLGWWGEINRIHLMWFRLDGRSGCHLMVKSRRY
jgi:hypothetical protein